ncbi:hypothetical protein J7K86_01835 [bacterium]|nr:hypothetical protein [bacterium]
MKKKKIIIAISVLVIIGSVFLFISFRKEIINFVFEQKKATIKTRTSTNQTSTTENLKQISPAVLEKNKLFLEARNFIERYGSYSSDSALANIKEVESIMSEDLKAQAERKILASQKIGKFYSLRTKVLSLNLDEYTPNEKAIFSANIQQEEIKGNKKTVRYKVVKIIFNKVEGSWKVSQYTVSNLL